MTINKFDIDITTGLVSINGIVLPYKEYDWENGNALNSFKAFAESNNIALKLSSDYCISFDCLLKGYEVNFIIERSSCPGITFFPLNLPKHPKDTDKWSGLSKEVNDYKIQQAENWILEVFGGKEFKWGTIEVQTTFDPHYSTEPTYQGLRVSFL